MGDSDCRVALHLWRSTVQPCPAAVVLVLAVPHGPSEPQPVGGSSLGHGGLAPHPGSTGVLFPEVPPTHMLRSSDGLLYVTLCSRDWGLRCAATHFPGHQG